MPCSFCELLSFVNGVLRADWYTDQTLSDDYHCVGGEREHHEEKRSGELTEGFDHDGLLSIDRKKYKSGN